MTPSTPLHARLDVTTDPIGRGIARSGPPVTAGAPSSDSQPLPPVPLEAGGGAPVHAYVVTPDGAGGTVAALVVCPCVVRFGRIASTHATLEEALEAASMTEAELRLLDGNR